MKVEVKLTNDENNSLIMVADATIVTELKREHNMNLVQEMYDTLVDQMTKMDNKK